MKSFKESRSERSGCRSEFIGFAYADSLWAITAMHPIEETWDGIDDREVLCGVFPVSDEDTSGSAKGVAE